MEPDLNTIPFPERRGDGAHDRRRSLLGLGFWSAMIFGLACVFAGVALDRYGPQLFRPAASPSSPAEKAAPVPPVSPVGAAVSGAAPAAEAPPLPDASDQAPDAAIFAINQRVGRLESDQHRQAAASAAVLAAAALQQASQTSRPFDDDLTAVEPLLPASTDMRALHRLAQTGAPTRSALASAFPAVAASAAVAARTPGKDAGPFAEALHALASIVTIRRVDDTAGKGPDAVLARVERLLDDGELDAASKALDDLPKTAQDSMVSWRSGLERRAEIDRRIGAVRASALRDLSRAAGREAAQ